MTRWSVRCVLSGHDDTVSRTANRLALRCVECGRTTRGWMVGTTKEETTMDKWTVIAARDPSVRRIGLDRRSIYRVAPTFACIAKRPRVSAAA
jgi:hypothetical protein